MRVNVLLFGAEAQALGRGTVDVNIEQGGSCLTIRERLAEAHAPLRPLLKAARFAVNSEFVALDHIVREGDEVALIGMVSGG
jgi:molybdopterin converting factor small subunit